MRKNSMGLQTHGFTIKATAAGIARAIHRAYSTHFDWKTDHSSGGSEVANQKGISRCFIPHPEHPKKGI